MPVDFPSQVTDTTPTFLVGGDAGTSQPAKAAAGTAGLALIAAATAQAAQQALGLGVPLAVSAAYTLAPGDDGKTLVVAGTRAITVNTGLGAGFGVSILGTVTFAGSATVTDQRTAGATNPSCALLATGTDTYTVIGSAP